MTAPARLPTAAVDAPTRERIAAAAARAGVTIREWMTAVVLAAIDEDDRFSGVVVDEELAAERRRAADHLRHVQAAQRASMSGAVGRIPRLR